jgi:hypothetical protein
MDGVTVKRVLSRCFRPTSLSPNIGFVGEEDGFVGTILNRCLRLQLPSSPPTPACL